MSNFGEAEYGDGHFFGGVPIPPSLLLEADAEVTNKARVLTARASTEDTSIQVVEFSIGSGGIDPFDYKTAVPVDPDAIELEIPILLPASVPPAETVGHQVITHYEKANLTSATFYCLLENSDGNEPISELGLWAKIVRSPFQHELAAPPFLAAITHFPLICKNDSMAYALRINVQF